MPAAKIPTEQDRDKVKAMSGYGLTQEQIAVVMSVTAKTLRKHYWRELETGAILANAEVANSLYKKAISNAPGSVTAAIFWLKARAGWREADMLPPADPAKLGKLDVENMSDSALEEIANAEVIDLDTGEHLDSEIL